MELIQREGTSTPHVDKVYFRYKKFLMFSPKEYTDKQFIFADGDCVYCYETTNGLKDSE